MTLSVFIFNLQGSVQYTYKENIYVIHKVTLVYRITLKEVKSFLPKINCKISTSKLRDLFQEVDTNRRGEIGFDDFSTLYHKLIFDQNVSYINK